MNADIIPLTGELLGLDLINTRARSGADSIDHLATPDRLRAWVALEVERLGEFGGDALAKVTQADLAPIRSLRECASQLVDQVRHGKTPSHTSLRELNQTLSAAPVHLELRWGGSSMAAEPRRTGAVIADLAAHLAEAVAHMLTDPGVRSIRKCEAEDCTMLFLPASNRRRWCAAARCGNRMRVARYYQRHKDS
ncbi:putative RNA-binding Zn ribbon-like protein [Aminobacter lissarensis]|uniref:RNA-binding Zn ribbon-like protein n=1 Tax=Aminobacter carboxidus TaxID=376165 RepID=A0A8E1WE17_9HYPH|nr:ABATE domain-containing protein [Aminobacter lissarensis]MBB6466996.1 putative RNA-binding Zn ribbon-like protein [Aminobacter lissarensis]